jgi:hypothetical protein
MNTDVTALRLSRTARTALEGAAAHPEHWVELPALPAAARNGVVRSMLRAGLVEEVASEGGNGAVPTLRATAVGLKAVRHDASHERAWPDIRPLQAQVDSDSGATIFATGEADLAQSQALVSPLQLRAAAEALLTTWEAQQGVTEAVAALRGALARRRRPATPSGLRQPRTDTKNAQVLALLGRTEGTTIAQVIELTGWAPNTVRGFLAGLKRKAISVEVLERARQVGSGKQGAKGSYSVYRLAAGEAG